MEAGTPDSIGGGTDQCLRMGNDAVEDVEDWDEEEPDHFTCPIALGLMQDPVTLPPPPSLPHSLSSPPQPQFLSNAL